MHTALHIFLRLSLCFFVGRKVQPFLLFTVFLSHFFNSGWNASLPGARGFFHWNSCLEVFDKKQKHLWIHKSNSPFESKGNSVLFLRFFFLGKVESQRNCSIPKRVKKELPVFLVQHVFFHTSPQKIQQKQQKHFAVLQKTGWSLGMRLSSQRWCGQQSTGAAFSPTCRAFICSTDDYFTEIDEDGGCSRGCVWVLQGEPLIFKDYLEIWLPKSQIDAEYDAVFDSGFW